MWGSALIEDDFSFEEEQVDPVTVFQKSYAFPPNGDGWFETRMGCTADSLVKRLRKARRHNKDNSHDIDGFIDDIRTMKSLETEATNHGLMVLRVASKGWDFLTAHSSIFDNSVR